MKSKTRNLAIATVIALAITSLSACGGEDKVAEPSSNGLPAVTANAGEAPTITAPTGAAPTTLQTQDIIVGTGTEIQASSTLTVHYTLMTWSNGSIVESSWSGGQPATFPLADLTAIPASILLLEPAILTLKNSSKLLAKIARNLALSKIGMFGS